MIYNYRPRTPELDRRFAEYLSGKTVAIFGRAGNYDIEQGEFIDSHDVVVRIHKMVPFHPKHVGREGEHKNAANHTDPANDPVRNGVMITDEWRPIIGSKCNVFYHRSRLSREWWKKFPAIFKAAGGKFICSDCHGAPEQWLDSIPHEYAPIRYVSWELKSQIQMEMRGSVYSGVICIADILSHDIKSAYLTGFLCHFDVESTKYEQPTAYVKGNLTDLTFLARLNKDDRVTVDENMQYLFDNYT